MRAGKSPLTPSAAILTVREYRREDTIYTVEDIRFWEILIAPIPGPNTPALISCSTDVIMRV